MWLWRVILPGLGLALCLLVGWQTFQAGEAELRAGKTTTRSIRERGASRVLAEGRVAARPGALVTVGAELGGMVETVAVKENARVKKDDLLVSLRSEDRKNALSEAEAKLAEAQAEVEYQKREYQRKVKAPTPSQSFSAEIDLTRRDYEVAVARKRAAEAAVAQCRSALARMRINAPIDGVIVACYAQPGELIPPGSRLVTVCDLARTWIEAEVDEFDAARIALGAEVSITAEGHAGAPWRGVIEQIPVRVEPRALRPEDPGRPTDTRVLLVKIATGEPLPLKLGQQVEVEIRLKSGE
jgi:RND family efflux transporter MFP subunit